MLLAVYTCSREKVIDDAYSELRRNKWPRLQTIVYNIFPRHQRLRISIGYRPVYMHVVVCWIIKTLEVLYTFILRFRTRPTTISTEISPIGRPSCGFHMQHGARNVMPYTRNLLHTEDT